MEARVDLQHHVEAAARLSKGARQCRGALHRIDAHGQAPQTAGERQQPPRLVGAHDGVGDEQVVEARFGEHLGLRRLRESQTRCAGRDLAAADLDDLVRLGVGAQANPARAGALRHARDIALEHVEIDEDDRGFEIVNRTHAGSLSP